MKLLSVSKSFVSSNNQAGRYRMAEPRVLPKFASVGRPVSLAPRSVPKESLPAAEAGPNGLASVQSAAKYEKGRSILSVDSPNESAPPPGSGAICVNTVPAATDFFRLRKNPFTNHAAGKTEAARAVQGELTLDAVKVVRNDLSDADYEVVQPKPGQKPQGVAPRDARPFKPGLTSMAWTRLTARWFSSERIRV